MLEKNEKCAGKDCPIRDNCYNYTTRHISERIVKIVKYDEENGCDDFTPNKFVTGL